ncbi:C40 family peptidase [Desulfurobacterium atlanticum]|uniref:LysM domain-containing protein n=1 Tax=Desulfurobacterium atlanticum TaxID=240169 RepID=A0A239AB38_9BACT|nr:C40 family peptidase [Desulfurobacterium atlanticum]SNR92551.1 LysM domain-containing protein [Desulfurobacterium atlanticum]
MKRWLIVFALMVVPATARADLYVVKKGDSLYKIAKKFHTTVKTIRRLNGLRGNILRPGQRLIVPGRSRFAKPKRSVATINLLEEKAQLIESDKNDALNTLQELSSKDVSILSSIVESESSFLSDAISTPLGVPYDNWSLSILNLPEYKSSLLKILANIFKEYKNTPYVFGYNAPGRGLDCSSFTMRVYRKLGIKLPRTARGQFNVGVPVSKEDLKVGDLVFFRTYARFPSHVGIYIGDGKFVHFSSMYHGLSISSLDSRYFRRRYIGAKRVLTEKKIREVVAKLQR